MIPPFGGAPTPDATATKRGKSLLAAGSTNTTAENAANKSTDGTMAANSATLYPSQSAVVAYVAASIPAAPVQRTFGYFAG